MYISMDEYVGVCVNFNNTHRLGILLFGFHLNPFSRIGLRRTGSHNYQWTTKGFCFHLRKNLTTLPFSLRAFEFVATQSTSWS